MHYLADTRALVAEGILTPGQARTIEDRSRSAMVALGANTLLGAGILAAAAGFVFWLGDAMGVAGLGVLFVALGAAILAKAGALYRMLGNASVLIGAGMLAGGGTLKALDVLDQTQAGQVLTLGGGLVMLALVLGSRYLRADRPGQGMGFVLGALTLMAATVHVSGLVAWIDQGLSDRTPLILLNLYLTALGLALGYLLDFRLVTALAILPFAQLIEAGTAYYHATYAFYSPEPALTVLQMALALIAAMWLVQNKGDRIARQAGMFGIMAFVVGNLAFLVGSLFGNVVGQSWFEQNYWRSAPKGADYSAFETALSQFRETTVSISPDAFSILWALALALALAYALFRGRRGLFNAALTFGAIHGYTQLFESFGDNPLAFVIAGLSAIPLAWGIWRMNDWFQSRARA